MLANVKNLVEAGSLTGGRGGGGVSRREAKKEPWGKGVGERDKRQNGHLTFP